VAGRAYRLAYLGSGSDAGSVHLQEVMFAALRERGYTEGASLAVERRFADGAFQRLPDLVAELAAARPDVLFVTGTQAAVAAAKGARGVPVVFAAVSYPVAMGLVRTLDSPGTNLTGVANRSDMLCRMRLELLKELFPRASRVAVIHNPRNSVESLMLSAMEEASDRLRLHLPLVEASSEQDYDRAVGGLGRDDADALYVIENPLSFTMRERIVSAVASRGLPAVYGLSEFAEAGGLMSYACSLSGQVREAAGLVDRVLQGFRPADLPVKLPASFELVLNRRTAEAQGVAFPKALLARADRVID
jgi:putative ABC transport system substrate-binding protein